MIFNGSGPEIYKVCVMLGLLNGLRYRFNYVDTDLMHGGEKKEVLADSFLEEKKV